MRYQGLQRSRARAVAAGAVGLVLVSAAVASAIPGSDGTFTGCYHKSTGALRVIDPAATTCRSQEQQIEWKDGITGPIDADTLDGLDSTDFLAADGKAADADTLDGLDSTDLQEACPAAFEKFRDLCVGESRAGTWSTGYYFCLNGGWRLPSTGEAGVLALHLFRATPGGFPNSEQFWTSDVSESGRVVLGETTPPNFFGVVGTATSTNAHFRCVTSPGQPEASASALSARGEDAGLEIQAAP